MMVRRIAASGTMLFCLIIGIFLRLSGSSDAGQASEPTAGGSFTRDGVAFLQANCLKCHGPERPKADLSLHRATNEESILKERKSWQRVIQVIQSGEMPPPNRPQPALAEKERFVKLIQDIFDRADRSGVVDPGHVTVRRLNRTEYHNTIRDLCYVDFNPSEDFPSDDIGHGFDNIGDVLTLPPVLMERYLAAAENIMSRAIVPNPPKPPSRFLSGRYLEPAAADPPVTPDGWRIITVDPNGSPLKTGPVHTSYKVPADGEYRFRAKVYAETSGTQPVKIALLARCRPGAPGLANDTEISQLTGAGLTALKPFRILTIAEVPARSKNKAVTIEATVPPGLEMNLGAVAVVKPPPGEPAPKVYVHWLNLEGPLDTRPSSQHRLLACDPHKPKPEQTREVVERFMRRAYRRPVTSDELQRVLRLVQTRESAGDSWEAAIQHAFTAVLCSPKFLFRIEPDPQPEARGPHPIDEYALASRLSYFLWASMPDEELFQLAAQGRLSANIEAQVLRMLKDPRAETLVDKFVLQWLQLERLSTFQADPKLFPKFDARLKASMLEETRLFFLEILREDRSVLDILDSNYTYINGPLARLYGIKDTAGNFWNSDPKKVKPKPGGRPFRDHEFVRVDLSGSERGGVLTQASVLTVTSNPTRTSPVKRGKWVLEQLLGTPPPPPPPNVPELEEDGKALTSGSLRQRMEEHRKNPACANCHAKMDPLGFGLENFDAIGAFRQKDGDFPIDPSGVLPDGQSFRGPRELKDILLAKKDLFVRCLAEKMLTYALGRGLEYYDKRAVDRIVTRMAANNYSFSSLVTGIATSDPFRLRRGKDQP
jgi:hypothetical protein